MLIEFVPSQAWFSGRLTSEWSTGGRKIEPAALFKLKNGKTTDNQSQSSGRGPSLLINMWKDQRVSIG
jgi:hypothetical protein